MYLRIYTYICSKIVGIAINERNLKKLHASARHDNLSEDRTRDDY